MKGIVVDASVTVSWLLEDEINETSIWAADQLSAGVNFYAPTLWVLETANAIFNAQRRKRIDKAYRDGAIGRIELIPVTLVAPPTLDDLKILSAYGDKYQLTIYDAEYLRVAKTLELCLATKDKALISAAQAENVPLGGK